MIFGGGRYWGTHSRYSYHQISEEASKGRLDVLAVLGRRQPVHRRLLSEDQREKPRRNINAVDALLVDSQKVVEFYMENINVGSGRKNFRTVLLAPFEVAKQIEYPHHILAAENVEE